MQYRDMLKNNESSLDVKTRKSYKEIERWKSKMGL